MPKLNYYQCSQIHFLLGQFLEVNVFIAGNINDYELRKKGSVNGSFSHYYLLMSSS